MIRQCYLLLCLIISCIFAMRCLRMQRSFLFRVLLILIPISIVFQLAGYLYLNGWTFTIPILFITAVFLENLEHKYYGLYFFIFSASSYSLLRYTWDCTSIIEINTYYIQFTICLFVMVFLLFIPKFANEWIPKANWREEINHEIISKEKNISMYFIDTVVFIWGSICIFVDLIREYHLSTLIAFVFLFFGGLFLISFMISLKISQKETITEHQYLMDAQRFMMVIRSQRHDYNFHVQTLQSLIEQEKYEECKKYLNELICDSINLNALLPIEDTAISALINSFQGIADKMGITLHVDVRNDLSQIVTKPYETNKIIGNLLQNALDETQRLNDYSYGIHLLIVKRGASCVIHVSNKVNDSNNVMNYQIGKSSKPGHEGIGLANTRELLMKYGGTVYTRCEDDIIHVVAKIPMKLTKR